MNRIAFLAITLVVSALTIKGQETGFEYYKDRDIRTLTGRNRQGGAYLGLTTGFSVIDNKYALLAGGRLSWIANQALAVGIGGTAFINEFHYEPSLDKDVFLTGAYGGIYLEPILLPRAPVHLSFPVLLGAGGISYITRDNDYPGGNFIEESIPFLLVEPAAEIELNVTRFFRLAFGASYRYPVPFNIGTTGAGFIDVSSLRGWSYILSMKFGKF